MSLDSRTGLTFDVADQRRSTLLKAGMFYSVHHAVSRTKRCKQRRGHVRKIKEQPDNPTCQAFLRIRKRNKQADVKGVIADEVRRIGGCVSV